MPLQIFCRVSDAIKSILGTFSLLMRRKHPRVYQRIADLPGKRIVRKWLEILIRRHRYYWSRQQLLEELFIIYGLRNIHGQNKDKLFKNTLSGEVNMSEIHITLSEWHILTVSIAKDECSIFWRHSNLQNGLTISKTMMMGMYF